MSSRVTFSGTAGRRCSRSCASLRRFCSRLLLARGVPRRRDRRGRGARRPRSGTARTSASPSKASPVSVCSARSAAIARKKHARSRGARAPPSPKPDVAAQTLERVEHLLLAYATTRSFSSLIVCCGLSATPLLLSQIETTGVSPSPSAGAGAPGMLAALRMPGRSGRRHDLGRAGTSGYAPTRRATWSLQRTPSAAEKCRWRGTRTGRCSSSSTMPASPATPSMYPVFARKHALERIAAKRPASVPVWPATRKPAVERGEPCVVGESERVEQRRRR